jgi:hypothetical protein
MIAPTKIATTATFDASFFFISAPKHSVIEIRSVRRTPG